jgi:hypothetical protein
MHERSSNTKTRQLCDQYVSSCHDKPFGGLGFGAGSGLILHTSAQWARKLGMSNVRLNRNTLMLSVLSGGALGMFLFAVSTGKEQVHNLHPIFQIGAAPPGELDHQDYQTKMNQAATLDMERMQQTRLARRRTLADSFQKRGLSDSHGGHWYKEDGPPNDEEELDIQRMQQIRMTRRRTLTDSFKKNGLSDSHGGHWDKEN